MSPSSLYSQQVLCSSIPLSKNVHSFFSAFCTEENIEQSISYLDQVKKNFVRRIAEVMLHNRTYQSYEKNTCPAQLCCSVLAWDLEHTRNAENHGDHLVWIHGKCFCQEHVGLHITLGALPHGVSPLLY